MKVKHVKCMHERLFTALQFICSSLIVDLQDCMKRSLLRNEFACNVAGEQLCAWSWANQFVSRSPDSILLTFMLDNQMPTVVWCWQCKRCFLWTAMCVTNAALTSKACDVLTRVLSVAFLHSNSLHGIY